MYILIIVFFYFFFFNDTATTEIYTLSLHDALPISGRHPEEYADAPAQPVGLPVPPHPACRQDGGRSRPGRRPRRGPRSEEHTSELQSRQYLVCRLLLEKKK